MTADDLKELVDISKTPHHLLMNLWLHAETDSLADDILFHARMYVQMGESMYRKWKEHYKFPNTTQTIFEREDTPDAIIS